MDPLTAALQAFVAAITLITKVWDATSPELKKAEADNLARFAITAGGEIIWIQEQLKKAVHP